MFEDDTATHLVMELCEGGSVLDGLKDGEYSERQVAHIMRAVVRFIAQVRAQAPPLCRPPARSVARHPACLLA